MQDAERGVPNQADPIHPSEHRYKAYKITYLIIKRICINELFLIQISTNALNHTRANKLIRLDNNCLSILANLSSSLSMPSMNLIHSEYKQLSREEANTWAARH